MNCIVVYKVDRLTRSLLDCARIMEVIDKHGVSFVSVTQQFNTTGSLGRLTLNILLSFAQLSNGAVEGMNNKIKSISHRSFGFRSAKNFIAGIYHCYARLPLPV